MKSVWMDGRLSGGFAPLAGRLDVDTVVVGGGITGVTTAWLLSQAGQRVALLEADTIGAGNTGRSTGNLYGTVSGGLAGLREHWPAEVVREMVALRLQAVDFIERTVGDLGLDCNFARRTLHAGIAQDEEAARNQLQDEFQATAEAGLAPQWLETGALPLGTARAFRIDDQAQFNPYRYTVQLARALAERGAHLHEHSAVVAMDADEGRVATANGEVRAQRIVLATHTPLGFNLVQAEMQVYRECGIAATLSRGDYPEGIFWVRDASRSVRSYHGPDHAYLVVVGEPHKPGHADEGRYDALRRYARDHFPVQDFTHAWSAQQYRAADGLPYIGPSGHSNVFIATGFAADGLTWGTVAARLLDDLVAGRENAATERLTPRRFTPIKSAKGWLAENRVVFEHLLHRLSPASAKDLSALNPGQGCIVEVDGSKCAAYRSPEGELSLVSAACTHLKCQVHWNATATSWDCPCHGSRFRPDGSVIEGPALRPLEPIGPDGGARSQPHD